MSHVRTGTSGDTDVVVHVLPPGVVVTVYLTIGRLPSKLGASHVIVATPVRAMVRVLALAFTFVGALGLLADVVTSIEELAPLGTLSK
jgi:hypothetical protein